MKRHVTTMLLSPVPLSCMVTPNRELANTLFPESSNTLTTPTTYYSNNMDMEVDTPRGRSVVLRESSAHSSISSIPYIKRMEAQSNNPPRQTRSMNSVNLKAFCFHMLPQKRGKTTFRIRLQHQATCPIHKVRVCPAVTWMHALHKVLSYSLFHIETSNWLNLTLRMGKHFYIYFWYYEILRHWL